MNKHTIYISLILILLAIIIVILNPSIVGKKDVEPASGSAEVYTCPMHPSVVSDRPGACPVCGMALVKKSSQTEVSKKELGMMRGVSLSPTQRVIANVSTTPAVRKSMENEINAIGVIDFAEPLQAKVTARFRGRIEKLFVNFTGEVVKKGQKLFELYSPDLIAAEQEFLLALKSQSDVADALYNSGTQQRLISAARERLRLTFGMTEAQLSDIETSGEIQSTITYFSPVAGTVLEKNVQEGEYVDEGSVLYQLADLSKVWVYLDIYEKDIRFLSLNQTVHITTESFPGEKFTGRMTFIDPVLNSETRTARVRTEFDNSHTRLKPQMWVKAHILLPGKEALIVPTSAILFTGKRAIVWVEIEENSFEPRDVEIGIQTEMETEILSNLEEGESVVTTGNYLLESESQLQMPSGGNDESGAAPEQHQHGKGGGAADINSPDANGEIKIRVKGSYSPDVIHLKKGKKAKLIFYRDEESKCTEEIVIPDFNIRRKLAAYKNTIIELTPARAGEIHFTCGMEMLHGKILVSE